jgi:hypothetical protein
VVARNGIADATLAPVEGQPGAMLRWDAAASWERLCDDVEHRYGWRPRLTSAGDAFRPYAVQERIFRQRYTTTGRTAVDGVGKAWDSDGNGIPEAWFRLPIWAAAATPGTSNHGWGVACDVTALGGFTGGRYRQFATVAAEHGWDNVEGKAIAEAWHWRYRPENDRHRGATQVNNPGTGSRPGIPTPGGSLPAPIPEDDLSAEAEKQIAALHAALVKGHAQNSLEHLVRFTAEIPWRTRDEVWRQPVSRYAEKDTNALNDMVRGTTAALETQAALAALTAALAHVSGANGFDATAVTAAAQAGAEAALAKYRLTLTQQ